ncbi:MAG: InlB B-repeat-containing protein, partial [Treponema sp.]|nr:InlB B-repeat-containing protein [Treponema sp.]
MKTNNNQFKSLFLHHAAEKERKGTPRRFLNAVSGKPNIIASAASPKKSIIPKELPPGLIPSSGMFFHASANGLLAGRKILCVVLAAIVCLAACQNPASKNNANNASSFTITFDKNHNDETGWTEAYPATKKAAIAIGELPIPPERSGYTFIGWLNDEGRLIDEKTVISCDITLWAQWQIGSGPPALTLYKNGSQVPNVDSLSTLVPILLDIDSISGDTDYNVILHRDMALTESLILTSNGTDSMSVTVNGDGNTRILKMGAQGC